MGSRMERRRYDVEDDAEVKTVGGYGRYDDGHIGCPRAKTDMTPCIARDGDLAEDDLGMCVGCRHSAAELLKELVSQLVLLGP